MTNSEPNVRSDSSDLVSASLRDLRLLGFARADTLAAMRGVSPLPASFARRLLSSSVRSPACLPRGFPPTPKPRLVSQPQTEQHGPLLAAARRAAVTFARRSALTRHGYRQSQRTPNHALHRTTALAFSFRARLWPDRLSHGLCSPPRSPAQPAPSPRLASRHKRVSGLRSVSLRSLGVVTRHL